MPGKPTDYLKALIAALSAVFETLMVGFEPRHVCIRGKHDLTRLSGHGSPFNEHVPSFTNAIFYDVIS